MRIIIVSMLVALFGVSALASGKPEKWEVTTLSDQTFLFEKKKLTVLVDVDFAPDSDEQVAKFIRSSDYVKAMKMLRTPETLGLEGQAVTVSASRKQFGTTAVGVVETMYKQDDLDAVLTEHWWVKRHISFHVSILTRGTFQQSNEEIEKIFEPFAQDLGLIEGKTALYKFLVPEAYADELRNGGRPRPVARPQAQAAVDCQRDAETMGVDPAKARPGPPDLSPNFTSATCKAGLKRIWDETKKSVFDLGNDFANRSARLRRQLQCQGYPPPPKFESAPTREGWGQMFSRWGRNVGTAFSSGSQAQMASNCDEAAANGALVQMAGNAVVGTVRGLVSLGQLTQQLQYELTVGQVQRTYNLIRYGKLADNDPMIAMGAMISNQWAGFRCLNPNEQAAKICKVSGEVAILVAQMAVGAGVSAAVRLARIAALVGRAVEAEQVAAKAALALKAARLKRDGQAIEGAMTLAQNANRERELAANALRAANLSRAERVRAASRILGREVTPAQRDAIARAHAFGKVGPNGKYSVPDLREKFRIMLQAGLSRDDAVKLIKTGVTGTDPAVAATALAAATEERTATTGQPGSTTAPVPKPISYDKAWRLADESDNQVSAHLEEFRSQWAAGNTSEAMNSLREAQRTALESGRSWERVAAMGTRPGDYRFAMENYVTAGDSQLAANARLAAVRTMGESPTVARAELRTAIDRLAANPRSSTDVMLKQRLATLRSTLEKFDAGTPGAVRQFEASGAARGTGAAGTRTVSRELTDPAPRLAGNPEPSVRPQAPRTPAVAPAQALPSIGSREGGLRMISSLRGDGQDALRMVRAAATSRDYAQTNEALEELVKLRSTNPSPAERANMLRAVQEIRRVQADGNLTVGNMGQLQSLENGLLDASRNPMTQVTNGRWQEAANLYRERLAEGWPREVVERDIRSQTQNATMMRNGIARNRVRIKNDTAYWDRIIETNQRVLRELQNP